MAAVVEVIGSRREREDSTYTYGYMIFAGEYDSTGLPSADAATLTFFTPPGGSAESGTSGRRCIGVDILPNFLPGLRLFQGVFKARKAYVAE